MCWEWGDVPAGAGIASSVCRAGCCQGLTSPLGFAPVRLGGGGCTCFDSISPERLEPAAGPSSVALGWGCVCRGVAASLRARDVAGGVEVWALSSFGGGCGYFSRGGGVPCVG